MVVLILMSVSALAVIFYKVFQFVQSGLFTQNFINPVMEEVKRGELTAAEHKLRSAIGPVATVMKVAIVCVTNRMMSIKSREAEISRVGSAEVRRLESHMRGLEMVATTAPLLGLLGTVLGMVTAFGKLEAAGSRVDPSMLAGGIWEALLTTVAGLSVAIPAVAAYYVLDGVIEKVRATMRDVTVQVLALEDEFIRNEQEQQRRAAAEEKRVEKEELTRQQREEHDRFIKEIQATEQAKFRAAEDALAMKQKTVEEVAEMKRQAALEAEEAKKQAIEEVLQKQRSMPQNTSTLKMLSPSYNR
jgi:biopolymer transport protein ExbB